MSSSIGPESIGWWTKAKRIAAAVVGGFVAIAAIVWAVIWYRAGREQERDDISTELDSAEKLARQEKENTNERITAELGDISREPDHAARDRRVDSWLREGTE